MTHEKINRIISLVGVDQREGVSFELVVTISSLIASDVCDKHNVGRPICGVYLLCHVTSSTNQR